MPIRFRCGYCGKLLGIARRKAGTDTTCPQCGATITVPSPSPGDELDEIDVLLNNPAAQPQIAPPPPARPAKPAAPAKPSAPPRPAEVSPSAARPAPQPPFAAPPTPPAATPRPVPPALPDGERPLFERDVDEVLGATNPTPVRPGEEKPKPPPASGLDAMSLAGGDEGFFNPRNATAVVVAVTVLLLTAFVAGFLIASR